MCCLKEASCLRQQSSSTVWLQGVAGYVPAKSQCPEGTLITAGFCCAWAKQFCGELQGTCRWICLYFRDFWRTAASHMSAGHCQGSKLPATVQPLLGSKYAGQSLLEQQAHWPAYHKRSYKIIVVGGIPPSPHPQLYFIAFNSYYSGTEPDELRILGLFWAKAVCCTFLDPSCSPTLLIYRTKSSQAWCSHPPRRSFN